MSYRGRGGGAYRYGNQGYRPFPKDEVSINSTALYGQYGSYNTTVHNKEIMAKQLLAMEGFSYKEYKNLVGTWDFGGFEVCIDKVQSDCYAPPSNIRVKTSISESKFPRELYENKSREIALRDYLSRRLYCKVKSYEDEIKKNQVNGGGRDSWLSAKGGNFHCDVPGQQILEQSAITIVDNMLVATLAVELPARGRSILGWSAMNLLTVKLPEYIFPVLKASEYNLDQVLKYVICMEDQDELRKSVINAGGVAFIPDGAILSRQSGDCDSPMSASEAIPFKSPESMATQFTLKSKRVIKGALIKRGITIITGGGYHGKSTLLKSLALGIYNHIPGDGREYLCTDQTALAVKAEESRNVAYVNISPFIDGLPRKKPTVCFSTGDASGSTSLASTIVESVELGVKVLLIDEDTAPTNFLYRDRRIQELVSDTMEPIKVLITKIKSLYLDHGCSTIMILGSCGDYIDVADTVICMHEYIPKDVTHKAFEIAKRIPSSYPGSVPMEKFPPVKFRLIDIPKSNPSYNDNNSYPKNRGMYHITFNKTELDLTALQQLVHISQTRSIAAAIYEITKYWKGKTAKLNDIIDEFERCQKKSVTCYLSDSPNKHMDNIGNKGLLAAVRRVDLGMALNRLRTLHIFSAV